MRSFSLKKFFTICLALFAFGAVIVLVSFILLDFQLNGLSGTKAVEGAYTEVGEVTDIKLNLRSSDINVSFGGEKVIVSYEESFTVKDKQITDFEITENGAQLLINEKKIASDFAIVFDFAKTKVNVTLPEGRAYNFSVNGDTADVTISGAVANFDSLAIETDTGDVTLDGTYARILEIKTDTGDVALGDIAVSDTASFISKNGDVSSSGRITANALRFKMGTDKIKLADAEVDAKSIEIETDTGDVIMRLVGKKADYSLTYRTDTGDTNVLPYISGERVINIVTDTGDLELYFTE